METPEKRNRISVVVVCLNEKDNISRCIDSLLRQTIGKDKYEIIVVDNGSNDGTQEIIKEYNIRDKRVRIVVNPARGIAVSRNIGLEEAAYEFVAFTDADCEAPENWLETLLDGYLKYYKQDNMVVAAGGANLPPGGVSNFYDAVGITLNTFWGNHGSAQGRIYKKDAFVYHIPTVNIMYKKETLLLIDGFDESFGNICEDTEINHRLHDAGYKFIFLKDSYVWHYMRDSLKKWAENMFTYGKGRVWVIKKHPVHLQWMYLIPPAFVILMLAVPLGIWHKLFLLPLNYFIIIILISIYYCVKAKKLKLFPLVSLIYMVSHFFYGFGEIYGLIKKKIVNDNSTIL